MIRPGPRRRACLIAAAAGGGALVAAFPPYDLWPLAAVAPVPLFWVASRPGIRRGTAGLSGLAFGLVFFLGTVYWLVPVMQRYGGIGWLAATGVLLLLVGYLALFPAAFALGVHRVARRHGSVEALATAPLLWVGLELLRNYLFSGFPWVRLGTALHAFPPWLQLASVTGVYGLSGLLAGLAAAMAVLLDPHPSGGLRRPGGQAWALAAVVAVLAAAALVWGAARDGGEGEGLRVACIQGNVDQSRKWDPREAGRILQRHIRLSEQAVAAGAQLVVWSESAVPYPLRGAAGTAVREFAAARQVPLVVGSLDWRTEPSGTQAVFNSAFLIGKDGEIRAAYDKVHLVPFGEYVPLQRLLSFVAPLVEEVGDLRAGSGAVVLRPGGGLPPLGVVICYEVIFPEQTRAATRGGAAILLNLTNDAWFGETAAPYQHFAEAVVRAVETGRFLVRAANTGISGVVDPRGRVLARSGLGEETIVMAGVEARETVTPYVAVGDVFAWACAILAAAALLMPRSRASTESASPSALPSRTPRDGR